MTPREARLQRLVRLRQQQHDIASLELRVSRARVAEQHALLAEAHEHARSALLLRAACSMEEEAIPRMLAWTEAQANVVRAGHALGRIVQLTEQARKAEEAETAARCERKQMEVTHETVQREVSEQAARAEQKRLDEIARTRSSASTGTRRVF